MLKAGKVQARLRRHPVFPACIAYSLGLHLPVKKVYLYHMSRSGHSCIVFADESGLGERYLVFGGVFVPDQHVNAVEQVLETFCRQHGFGTREMSWKKCSKGEVDRYCGLVGVFGQLPQDYAVEFRALVVDTRSNPLKHPESGAATAEEGFYKFYHFFITRSIEIIVPSASRVLVHVADLPDQYRYRTEILTKTVAGKLRELLPQTFELVEVHRGTPKGNRLYQLADVLTGAVSYRLNERESAKEEICSAVEKLAGKKLDRDFFPGESPFNVWFFTPIGQERWAKGSTGRRV